MVFRFAVIVLCLICAGCSLTGVKFVEPVGSCIGQTCGSGALPIDPRGRNTDVSAKITSVNPSGGSLGSEAASFDELYTAPLNDKTEVRLGVTRTPRFRFNLTIPDLADPPAGEEYGVWLFRVEPVLARQVGTLVRLPETHTYTAEFAPVGDWGDVDRVILTRQVANRRVPFSAVVKLREITLSSSAP